MRTGRQAGSILRPHPGAGFGARRGSFTEAPQAQYTRKVAMGFLRKGGSGGGQPLLGPLQKGFPTH